MGGVAGQRRIRRADREGPRAARSDVVDGLVPARRGGFFRGAAGGGSLALFVPGLATVSAGELGAEDVTHRRNDRLLLLQELQRVAEEAQGRFGFGLCLRGHGFASVDRLEALMQLWCEDSRLVGSGVGAVAD